MDPLFVKQLYQLHHHSKGYPSPDVVAALFVDLISTLFPDFAKMNFSSAKELALHMESMKLQLDQLLHRNPEKGHLNAEAVANAFFEQIPRIYQQLNEDIDAMFAGDPAAKSRSEIIRTYPGFYAIAAYRIAHTLHKLEVKALPRMITEHAHSKTGIDIHPGATIGSHFCIDHGTGVVIGETSVIGNQVKIYQGVTLGALSVRKEDAEVKRHPTLEDRVVVYAGATILGGETVIGHDSVIGGSVWLTKSVEPFTKIYYQSKMYNSDTGEMDLVIYNVQS